jgi:hypothetical protein
MSDPHLEVPASVTADRVALTKLVYIDAVSQQIAESVRFYLNAGMDVDFAVRAAVTEHLG